MDPHPTINGHIHTIVITNPDKLISFPNHISPLTDADVGHPQITATTTATAAGDAG